MNEEQLKAERKQAEQVLWMEMYRVLTERKSDITSRELLMVEKMHILCECEDLQQKQTRQQFLFMIVCLWYEKENIENAIKTPEKNDYSTIPPIIVKIYRELKPFIDAIQNLEGTEKAPS